MRSAIRASGADAFLVNDIKEIRYLSGFTGSSAYIVAGPGRGYFLTDSRYTTQAASEVRGYQVRTFKKALDGIAAAVKALGAQTLAFEPRSLTFESHGRLRKALAGVRLKAAPGMVSGLRKKKDAEELKLLRASARLLDSGFAEAMGLIGQGVVEEEAAFALEVSLRGRGAEAMAFDTIVASGPRGALPHGKASRKRIRKGELVILDMGVVRDGYNSDETRTFVVGRPSARQKEIYGIVKEAQQAAIEAVRPGVAAAEVDRAARKVIEDAGYGREFGHGTGHGVGLEIHEAPSVGPTGEETLEEGMVITVEPGIYIPGWGGVRIEDMVLVAGGGAELLTRMDKELASL